MLLMTATYIYILYMLLSYIYIKYIHTHIHTHTYYCLLSVFIGIIYFSLQNHHTDQVLLFPVLWMSKQAQRGEVLVKGHRANKSINVGHSLGF